MPQGKAHERQESLLPLCPWWWLPEVGHTETLLETVIKEATLGLVGPCIETSRHQ
jgi:hypothetical protein